MAIKRTRKDPSPSVDGAHNYFQMLTILSSSHPTPSNKEESFPVLSFEFLEDVMALPSHAFERLIGEARIVRIGPLVEYAYHDWKSLTRRLESIGHSPTVRSLTQVVQAPERPRFNPSLSFETTTFIEFCPTPQTAEEVDDPHWIAFCQRLMNAGLRAGLSKKFSQGLVGTMEEMMSNIIEHSECARSGIVGYRWTLEEFEYVVADSGIGVMTSLLKHPDYSWIEDAGEALEVAVSDGESRYGKAAHRGTGFHHLLYNIASRDIYLRFRSGDHCYSIDGTVQPILKKTYSCPPFDGFLISLIAKIKKQSA